MRSDGGAVFTHVEQQLPQFIQTKHPKFAKFIEKYYEFLELNLITFNDLDLNEDKPIQESANVTFTVTVATGNNAYSNSVNKYYVNSETSPTLSVNTGTTYIFNQSDATNAGHPLRISLTPNGRHTPGGEQYSNGINMVAFGTPGTAGAQTSIYITPDLAGNTLYYYCNTHSGMGGSLSIANTTPFISLENGNTDSSNTNSEYVDLENPNRQGDQFLSGETVKGSNSGATGVVRGKYSTTQAYVEETSNGNFQIGERIVGQTSRVSANVTAYTREPLNASRNVKAFQDVDKAPAGFVELFRKEFLQGLSKGMLADKAQVLKNIKDFYRAKGNEASFQYIFRILYGKEDVTFYYPSNDIMRLSDGRWTLNKTLKIDRDQANNFASFEGRTVTGSVSNVSALVERTETYQVGSSTISELYLSNIDANNASYNANTDSGFTSFIPSDRITTTSADDDGNFATAPLTGIIASVSVDSGGSNYKVGDEINVSGGGGREGGVKVASVSDATISSFDIIDPGDGFSVGDAVTFVNEGTGGSGGAARVQTIVPTANVFNDSFLINTNREDLLNSTTFTAPLDSAEANTHLFSNSTTTFSAGVTGTAPKKGDFLFELSVSQFVVDQTTSPQSTKADGTNLNSGDFLVTEAGERFDDESIADDTNYNANTAKFGTVVSVDTTTTPNTIIYAIGSVVIDSVTGTKTVRNFQNTETVFVYDTQRDGTGSPASANGHNAVLSDTGANVVFANTPAAVTSNTSHGALAGSLTEVQVGAIRSIQVLSSGQGYNQIPVVSVANTKIESFQNAPDKVGANSVFVTLASAIANQFSGNTIVKNQGNTATGLVLGPITSNTTLVSTGNTVLRVQMTTSNNFSSGDTLTAYTNNADENPVGIGDFGTANVSTSGATATFTQADHGLVAGQRIVVTGSSSGTDATVYNNNHTIAAVTNSSVFTVTFPSTPTDTSESDLRTRRVVSANVAASNSIFANTGFAGNNATISISSIAIGAIQTVTIYNFGANYTSAPTLDASGVGGGDATLTATLGALAEYDGFFDGPQGILSGQGRMQDNYYYQDFSYVIKTDIDTKTYRDKILNLVHPAGLALFGEIVMYLNAETKMYSTGSGNNNYAVANTQLVSNTSNVPYDRVHEITIATQNTVSSNVQISMQTSLFRPTPALPEIDAKVKFPGQEFDLVLEHANAGLAVESAGDTIAYETATTGSLLLDDGHSKLQTEEFFDSIIQEDESNLELETGTDGSRNYLLFEPAEESTQIVSEDDHDVFNIRIEEDGNDYLIEQEGTEYEYILFENDDRMMGIDNSPDALLMTLETVEFIDVDTNVKVIDRELTQGFSIPKIQFPEEETGLAIMDLGYGTQLKLEDDSYLLLERTEGMFPIYLAMEDSMQDEVFRSTQVEITPQMFDEVPAENLAITIDNRDGQDDQTLMAENGDRFIYDSPTETFSKASALTPVYVDLAYGTNRAASFTVQGTGVVNSTGAELFELLTEDGNKYRTESTGELFELATEDGRPYLLEQSYLSNQKFVTQESADTFRGSNLILEQFVRQASVLGTGTDFDNEFNSPIVLEDDNDTLVDEIFGHRFIREGDEIPIGFATQQSDFATSYITLEEGTQDGDLILSETDDDRVFLPLELEDASGPGHIGLEVSVRSANRRLLYNDPLDLIVEGEGIALEEDDRILMEDFNNVNQDPFVAENGNNFVLEHTADNLATEGERGNEHLTFDFIIGDFTADIALEGDNTADSITLESHTPTSIGDILLTANGDRLVHENDGGGDRFFLSENSFASSFSEGKVTILNDSRLSVNQSDNLISEDPTVNLVAESGDNFVSEVGRAEAITSEVEIVGFDFPHGSHEFARFVLSDGDTVTVTEKVDNHRYNVDVGAIILEEQTGSSTDYLVDEFFEDKMLRDLGNSTAQTYILEYGRHDQKSSINDASRTMKTEIGTTDTNNAGREYQFQYDGIKTSTGTSPTIEELSEIHGDNIVYETGEGILMEDGEVGTQDPNAILQEGSETEYITLEENEAVLLEDTIDYKLLNFEEQKFRIEFIANNTFLKTSQEINYDFTDKPIRVNHLEPVPS